MTDIAHVNAVDEVMNHLSRKRPVSELGVMNLSMADFDGCRKTSGPNVRISVIDSIMTFRGCAVISARSEMKRIVDADLHRLETHKFPGARQRPTPVATFTELQTILSQLPGKQAKRLRTEQAVVTSLATAGAPELEQAVSDRRATVELEFAQMAMAGLTSNVDEWKTIPVHTMYMIVVCKVDQLLELPGSLPLRRNSALDLWDKSSDKSIVKVGYTGNWPTRLKNYRNFELKNTNVTDVHTFDMRDVLMPKAEKRMREILRDSFKATPLAGTCDWFMIDTDRVSIVSRVLRNELEEFDIINSTVYQQMVAKKDNKILQEELKYLRARQ